MTREEEAMVLHEPSIVRAAASPQDISTAFEEYRQLQTRLDATMKDSVMTISGKKFRKKSYWRAIATAFNLDVTSQSEELIEKENDFGYIVTYIAKAPNGRSNTGDGACFASEKKAANQKTVHNIRSHAHTRAYNRAVSNLVGFGEVSAEEMIEDAPQQRHSNGGSDSMTTQQQAKLYAVAGEVAKERGAELREMMQSIYSVLGLNVHSSKELTKQDASKVIDRLTQMQENPGED